jgi:hypothetical protein
MVIEQVVTLGNLIVILIVIIGAVASTLINGYSITSKTAVFVAATEMKFQAGEKKFVAIEKDIEQLEGKCTLCPNAAKLVILEKEKLEMKGEQIKLRAELPIQLKNIEEAITAIKKDIAELRNDLALSKKA